MTLLLRFHFYYHILTDREGCDVNLSHGFYRRTVSVQKACQHDYRLYKIRDYTRHHIIMYAPVYVPEAYRQAVGTTYYREAG